jgi:hypothetical protein
VRTKSKPEPKSLTPPDFQRCQAIQSNGVNFMSFGGRREMVRCGKVATMLATENKPKPSDGQIGSMTVCDECFAVMQRQVPPGTVTYRRITKEERR